MIYIDDINRGLSSQSSIVQRQRSRWKYSLRYPPPYRRVRAGEGRYLLDPLGGGWSACILISRDKQISVYSRGRRVGILRGSSARCATCPGYLVCIAKGKPCLDRSHPLIVIFRLCDTCNPNDDLFITRFVRSDVDASLGFFRGFVGPWIKTRRLDVKSGRVS